MAGELLRPGITVIQTIRNAAPTFVKPTLAPCIVGPAFEVINVLNSDGTINSGAKFGTYAQIPLSITESSFPTPRGNADELDVQEATVAPFMQFGGNLNRMPLSPYGSAFLAAANLAAAASISTVVFGGGGLALNGTTLTLAIDVPTIADTSKDVIISFTGSGALTAQQAADQINAAVGATIATVSGTSPNAKVVITSTKFSALSSVTVRKGGTANTLLQIGYSGGSNAHEERVEGAGFRAQDQANNTTVGPWIEFYQGAYMLDGVDTTFISKINLVNVATGTATSAKVAAQTFTGGGASIPLSAGDFMFADGLRPLGAEISKVEASRFKLGVINTALSVADSNGNYTSKVYKDALLGTILDDASFAPKYAYFVANNIDYTKVAPTAATITGSVAATAATVATVTGTGALAGPLSLAGLKLHYILTVGGVVTDASYTFTGGPFADMAAVAANLQANISGITAAADGATPPQLIINSVATGASTTIVIKKDGTANSLLGWSTSADTTGTGTDDVFTSLSGKNLQFKLNGNSHVYNIPMLTNSLEDAIAAINAAVGFPVASKDSGRHIVLTSTLKGAASGITVIVPGPTQAETVMGLTGSVTAGAGRPFPDVYLDQTNTLNVQAAILRDQVTGTALDQTTNTGSFYIQYKALRKDVSPLAKQAGVLHIPDVTTLGTVLNPLDETNPLGLGVFMAMLNAPSFEVKALGVDEVTSAAPEGTSVAYARAASMLEAEEVYAIAPLTQDEVIHGLWSTHASVMSDPNHGGERIAFINKKMPLTKNPVIAASGVNANSTSTDNQLLLDVNPAPGLVAAGLNPAQAFTVAMGVYVEFSLANGTFVRYNVSSVSGSLVNFNTTFSGSQNADAFYTTSTFNSTVIDATWSLKVRGASLFIPGSNPPRLDYSLVAETVGDANATLLNRRLFSVFPDTIKTVLSGVEKKLPGYYACAAITGMVAAQPPQQGFTNFPIVGLTGVVGTEKFTKTQLNVMAAGGTYILIQDVQGGAVSARHQLSTNLSSIEARELSITKVVDFVAKFMRLGVRKFIGINNINPQLLDTLGTAIQGMLAFLIEAGVLNGAELNNLVQDATQPDTVLIDVTLSVPFPCNYIRITLVV